MTNWTLSTLRDRMSGRRHPALLVGMTLLLVATSALAQPPFEGRGDPRKDPFGESVFPPDLVMENQGEIDLGADQKQALIQELQRTPRHPRTGDD